ncbi:MAG: DNA-protecting protein DprA, partial [Dehalococcoidia bacterium]|nr:DNA-protecting protein DprA [Dehalococcoidia bacterium]
MERLERAGVTALAPVDARYPSRLREIDDAPPLLYVRGEWRAEDEWSVAVAGTRRATAYGRQAAVELCRGLAATGVTIVSGLARGIDTIAHRTALEAGGRT